jgi:opacity protein-like surface antigen
MVNLKTLSVAGMLTLSASAALAADPGMPHHPMPAPPPMMPMAAPVEVGEGWYLRGDMGVGIYSTPTPSVVDAFAPADLTFGVKGLDAATLIGAGVGYQFNNWLRADITGQYRTAGKFTGTDRGTFTAAAPGGGAPTQWGFNNVYNGSVSAFVALANAYVDLGTWNCLTPFLGVGVGLANVHFGPLQDTGTIGPVNTALGGFGPTGGGYAPSKSKTNLAWALHAGLAYAVSPNLKLELGYSYLNMGSAESGDIRDAFSGANTRLNYVKLKDIDSHDIKIGMRWTFGDPTCCAGSPPPPPMPLVRKY